MANSPDGSKPEDHAIAALEHFQREQYNDAVSAYDRALQGDPNRLEWQEMRDLARANAISEVHVPVPPVQYFDRDELLAPVSIPAGTLPTPLPKKPVGILTRIRRIIANVLGAVATVLFNATTGLLGRLCGYQKGIWTSWYNRKPGIIGVLTLAYMRDQLNKHNLYNVYAKDRLDGFQPPGAEPPEGVTHFRTADGSWNNLQNPKEGAAGTRFPRNVELSIARPEPEETLLDPSPREISRKLLARKGDMKPVKFLNVLAAAWIQFMNHDWINHSENIMEDQIEIPLAADDPVREKYKQESIRIPRTQPDPTRMPEGEPAPVTFINEVTHWWDGSQIYGSDQTTLDGLRSGVDGKLTVTSEGTLPLDSDGIEQTGFTRNWWLGLALLHNLFVLEHNRICERLHETHPDWDDNRLFNVARLINAAVMAKIHTIEWTPAILPNPIAVSGVEANWYGLLTNMFKSGSSKRTLADINIRNPELGGVVGNPIDAHGGVFGLTEEFVEIYRIHSLLPEAIHMKKIGDDEAMEEVPIAELRQAGSAKATGKFGMLDILYSFGNQLPGQMVLNNYPKFLQELSVPGSPFFDMGTIDILRCRERGIPRYNEFRRQLGLNPIKKFEDLTDDKEHVRVLKEVYGDQPEDVEKLDLMVGTLGEGHRPTKFGFGETMFQIFILNASRRLQADRFYTDSYNEETYSAEGLQWIDETDMKAVLLRNYPDLASTGLANVKNAFEPWDEDDDLDPERHPLREYDKELKP